MPVPLAPQTFTKLRRLIYQHCGIWYPDNKRYLLEGQLAKRLPARACETYEGYLHFLEHDTAGRQELTTLFDVITINETYFFRDAAQLQAFTDTIIPSVRAGTAGRSLRIWSAACSTGEEPYTLAMLCLEHPALRGLPVEIQASDISQRVLDLARAGVYSTYALRKLPSALLDRYFRRRGDDYEIGGTARQLVHFQRVNLYTCLRPVTYRDFDVIFCRNCLIYFDDAAKQRIVANLHDALRPGGYLMIGFSETLQGLDHPFKTVYDKSLIYQKPVTPTKSGGSPAG